MKPAFDLTSVRLTLRHGIEKGYWTMEDLDHASEGWNENLKRFRVNHPNYPVREYRNPLRDDPQPVQPVQTDPGYNPHAEFPF